MNGWSCSENVCLLELGFFLKQDMVVDGFLIKLHWTNSTTYHDLVLVRYYSPPKLQYTIVGFPRLSVCRNSAFANMCRTRRSQFGLSGSSDVF